MRDRINIPVLASLWVPVLCLVLATGCTREEAIDGPESGNRSEIHFFTSTQTRAGGSGLATSAKVRIYPYHRKTGTTAPVMDGGKEYVADATAGTTLTPAAPAGTDAKNMILPAGTFGFYAISTNSSTEELPAFNTVANDGYPTDDAKNTTALVNGIDYLHAVREEAIQFGSAQEVPLTFKHIGTQVQLTIQFDANACAASETAAQNFAKAEVWVQQTDVTNVYMYLRDGQVRVGNNVGLPFLDCGSAADNLNTGSMAKMSVEKVGEVTGSIPANQVATFNMLPLRSEASRKMWIKVVIADLKVGDTPATTHTYSGQLDASNGWNPGERNSYTLILKGNEISFSGVTVEDWKNGTSGVVGGITDSSSSTTTN